MGRYVWEMVAPHERERLKGYACARMHGEAMPLRYEWQGTRRDGRHIWLDCLVTVISWDKRPAIMSTIVDISKPKRQEQKEQRLLHDIHDGITQLMVSAQQYLDDVDDLWHKDQTLAYQQLQLGTKWLHQAIDETRRLLAQQRPMKLDTLGLIPAIQNHLQALSEELGWEGEFVNECDDLFLFPEQEEHLFHIVNEALSNARKHANTKKIEVAFRQENIRGDMLFVTIRDWGIGFDCAKLLPSSERCGLLNIQERVKMLDGVCIIDSQPCHGTTVRVRLALSRSTHGVSL